jgi:RNA polymerase sigma-70 factor (ECF subfamily)
MAEMALRSGEVLVSASTSERGLVELCQRGDAQAFARLVALHEGMVLNLAARLLGDLEEARDLSQDVFLQVYRTLGGFEGRSSLKTWIYRIVVNQCRNRRRFFRRRRKDRSLTLDELKPKDAAKLATEEAHEGSPFEQVSRIERAERVQKALLQLSFEHRAILLLREVEALSCEQISAALAIPGGTVKSRLARARESLRRILVSGLEGGRA